MPDIVLIAIGSPDPLHRAGVERLVDAVRDRVRSGRGVGACYLDHDGPTPRELADELSGRAIAVPLSIPGGAWPRQASIRAAVGELAAGGVHVQLRAPIEVPELINDDDEAIAALADLVIARVAQDARLGP